MDIRKANAEGRSWQFSVRFLLLALTMAALCLGAASYIRLNTPRWQAEAALRKAERQRIDAEKELVSKADYEETRQLIADLEVIKKKIGRYPNDEPELILIRGKPMPMTGTRIGRAPVIYKPDGGHYSLTFAY